MKSTGYSSFAVTRFSLAAPWEHLWEHLNLVQVFDWLMAAATYPADRSLIVHHCHCLMFAARAI
jgi:hypothetical protein